MADEKQKESGAATQSTEARKDVLASTAAVGGGSATGQAREQESGREDDRLEKADKRPAPEGAPTKGDFSAPKPSAPTGLQAEAANFTTSGTIPAAMVSSPSGFVPISSVSDPEAALERTLAPSGRNPDNRELSEDEIEGLSGGELRAIGTQRGYTMPELAGNRTMRRVFVEKQGEDKRFQKKSR